jgi:hypothetical protein
MMTFDPETYGPYLASLLGEQRLNPLGPGSPNRAVHDRLRAFTAADAFAPRPVRDESMAQACLAGLWLYHDFLDESHAVSQDIAGPSGSYWHGLMHRREPDFDNARYWFRRVGDHPVYEPLRAAAGRLAVEAGSPPAAAFLATQRAWDPFAFIELCEVSYDERAAHNELCRRVQRVEWELLFAYCHAQAVGR